MVLIGLHPLAVYGLVDNHGLHRIRNLESVAVTSEREIDTVFDSERVLASRDQPLDTGLQILFGLVVELQDSGLVVLVQSQDVPAAIDGVTRAPIEELLVFRILAQLFGLVRNPLRGQDGLALLHCGILFRNQLVNLGLEGRHPGTKIALLNREKRTVAGACGIFADTIPAKDHPEVDRPLAILSTRLHRGQDPEIYGTKPLRAEAPSLVTGAVVNICGSKNFVAHRFLLFGVVLGIEK